MGLEAERFAEVIDDDLKCGICYSVLEDPLVTSCGHVYCSQCLVPWIAESGSCPLTCEQLAIDDLKKIAPLTNLIAKLDIRCENFRRGCQIILKVEHIHSHHLKCQYAKENTVGCKIMKRAAVESRELSQVVLCKSCALPLLHQDSCSHNCIKALQIQVASLQMKLTKTELEKEVTAEKHAKKEEALQDRIISVDNELHCYQVQVLNLERQLKEYRSRAGYLQRQLGHRRAAEEIEVDVQLERSDGTLGFNIMGGTTEVGSGDEREGIVVSKVADGGPAASRGLRVYDRVLKVNGVDLRRATHSKAVETIKTATDPVQLIVLRGKVERNIEYYVNEVFSTGTQTDICHDVDTDSGIHDRYSPRQDLQLDGCKSLDEGTSSSESSHQRIDTVRERLFSLTSDSLASLQNTTSTETSETSIPRVTVVGKKDVNYVNGGVDEDSLMESLQVQPFVSAVSDEIYFDPELDYEYEEITLWIGNSDLGLTFSCLEEDESAVYVCDIEPGSVVYLDGRLTLLDQVLKINDAPVTDISDIEPMVCESSSTIKFLVARPAQEVQATLVGCSEGSGRWNEFNGFGIGVIKEEDEDGAETVSSEKTNVEKCEKDSGVGRNDESSEQDVAEESVMNVGKVDKCSRITQQKEELKIKYITSSGNSTEKLSSQGNGVKVCENDRTVDHSKRQRRSPTHGASPSRAEDSPKRGGDPSRRGGDASRRGGDASNRKSKGKAKTERKKGRESSKDTPVEETKSEHNRQIVQLRSQRIGNVNRSVRTSYIRACNKDSIRHINLIGSNGLSDELECDNNNKSEYHKNVPSALKELGGLKDAQSMENFHQSMEWKVRITKDGSQIFVQKKDPVTGKQARNKLLRERAQKITDERKGLTTDDDTHTVYQGRYWPRESRRRQLEKVREARKRKTHNSQKASDSGLESGKRDVIVQMSHRKLRRKHERFDDFVTVQEILRQRNPGGVPSGLIHVTTV